MPLPAHDIERVSKQFGLRKRGREYVGPCPICGGDDRFHIRLNDGLFGCRGPGCGDDRDFARNVMRMALGEALPYPTASQVHFKRQETETALRLAAGAAAKAQRMIEAAHYEPHPYLAAKGHPEAKGLVLDGVLLIPMRHYRTGALQSLQRIDLTGHKKMLYGGTASHAVHRIGRGTERWCCEGYATALSIQAALRTLYRQAEIVVCFSASNIPKVAEQRPRSYVIADHDPNGVGEEAARKTGLPYWRPQEPGTDANDYHVAHGTKALAVQLWDSLLCEAQP